VSVAGLMRRTGLDLADECVWVEVPSSDGLKPSKEETQTV